MQKRKFYLFPVLIFLFSFYITEELQSYPRFSAYTGDKCITCHVSPTGGSMRNLYGTKYAEENLEMEIFKKISEKTKFSPRINDDITIGGDVRIAQIDNEIDGQPNQNTFLTMQGDLYVDARLNRILNVFVSSGIEIPNFPTKYEVYGMISRLPLDIYFRAGRFAPDFGIKIVEHRAFQGVNLLGTPYAADAGFEIGMTPGILNFNMGLFNGLNTIFFDTDQNKMFVTKADITLSTDDYNYNFNIGGSFFNNPYNIVSSGTSITANRKAFGGFTKIGIHNIIALLGEFDLEENTINGAMTRRLFGFGELNIKVMKGVEVRGQYEYFDANRDVDDDNVSRYSFGAVFFPFPGFETEAMVRFVSEETDLQNNEFQWNFHFYF